MDAVRGTERELKFASKVIAIMLSKNEIYKIKDRSNWDDNRNDWKIPTFYFDLKDKNIAFPTINAKGTYF